MNKNMSENSILHRILKRLGGWYLLLAVFLTQLFAGLGALAAGYTVQVNAEFSIEALQGIIRFSSYLVGSITVFVLIFIYFRYRSLRKKLDAWKKDEAFDRDESGWREVTAFSWRLTLLLFGSGIFVEILPAIVYVMNIPDINFNQVVFSTLGLIAGVIGTTIFALFIIEHLLTPVREVMLPENFTDQIHGDMALRLSRKLPLTILALIITALLLSAPIGYHQTAKALETGLPGVLDAMRIQSLVVAVFVIFYGIALATTFARSISTPLDDILETFGKIEAGNLKERAKVSSSDELGRLAIYFNRMISQLDELQTNLESQIEERTEQLRATAEVGRAASSILDPDELVEEIVNLITERLGYYYAAIFILSPDGSWAELRSATGEAGAELKARQHRLSVGGKSMVGSAVSLRQARIAHDVGLEAVRFNNPLLPETRSEIALPLMVGGRVLGALDAQSTEPNAFDEEKTETLLGMANQVAVALENARLYKEAQEALREIRANQQTQLSTAWSQIAETEEKLEFSIGQENYRTENEGAKMNIPLALRDQIIGEVSIVGDENWSDDDRAWVSAVARQAAFAIENARLLEESQQTALQERVVSEITSKIWSSTTIEGILQVAITELGRTLGANEAIIKLETDDQTGESK